MSIAAAGGPTVSTDNHFEAEAYEKIEADIPKDSVATTVEVQPGALTQLQAIIITAERYEKLTFTVDEEVTVHTLDGPLMLVGAGNIAMLGATLGNLVFTNTDTEDANMVTILVARTAIEPGT
jgi:hypothetical protein